jgi:hypothetical protein
MLRRNRIITATALAACALPAPAAIADPPVPVPADHVIVTDADRAPQPLTRTYGSPDALDANEHRGLYARDRDREPQPLQRAYGSPDGLDANQHRGLYALDRDREPQPAQRAYGSPDALDAAEHRGLYATDVPAQTVTVRELPSPGFDWGDAGIGAAGMLALLSIAAGSTLVLAGWRRRREFQVVSH